MRSQRRIAVVGFSLAGLRAAQAARAEGFEGDLLVIGAESHLPYDRPPLSKELLRGEQGFEAVALCPQNDIDALDAELLLGTRAHGLDLDRRRLLLDGDEQPWDGLIIATGCAVRMLPGAEGLDGVFALRSLDDAISLRAALERANRVVVVGAGFIGGEVAASARALGLEVTVLEGLPAPLLRAIGPQLAEHYRELHEAHGTDLRCGVQVDAIEGNGRVEAVRLTGGARVEADVVVVGIGVRPATDWLEGSGLRLEDGVCCDSSLMASPGVYAAGDVARWENPRFGASMRVEHWTNAAEQGVHAARNLVGGIDRAYDAVPYFWSDQYGIRLQFAGRAAGGDEVAVLRPADGRFRAIGLYGRSGHLSAALAVDAPGTLTKLRLLLQRGGALSEAIRISQADGFEARAG